MEMQRMLATTKQPPLRSASSIHKSEAIRLMIDNISREFADRSPLLRAIRPYEWLRRGSRLGGIMFWISSATYNTVRSVILGDRPPAFCNERIVEIPWALRKIRQHPTSARILELGNVLGPALTRIGYRVQTVDSADSDEIVSGWTHIRMDVRSLEVQDRYDIALSISTIEHIGLGHYGDPIDPQGDRKAVEHLADALRTGGLLYATVPFAPVAKTSWQRFYDYPSLGRLFNSLFSTRIEVYDFSGIMWRRLRSERRGQKEISEENAGIVRQVALIEAAKKDAHRIARGA